MIARTSLGLALGFHRVLVLPLRFRCGARRVAAWRPWLISSNQAIRSSRCLADQIVAGAQQFQPRRKCPHTPPVLFRAL